MALVGIGAMDAGGGRPLWVVAAGLAALAALGAVLVVVARRRAAVLDELMRSVGALSDGRPARPVRGQVGGRLGRLARLFNTVLPRLEARTARLERERQQLRAVLRGMAEGVIVVDERRRLVFANPSAERLFGLDPQAVGRLVPEIIRSPPIQDAVEATLHGPGPYRGEVTLSSGEALPRRHAKVLSVQGTPFSGPPPGAVLVFHDITELRRLERMRQDFVANASHELKTPLAAIKAYTETLLDWALRDETVNVRFLEQIAEQAGRLEALVLDMLRLARLESGEAVYHHGPLAVAPVVRACAEAHRGRAEARSLQLRLDLDALGDSDLVSADEEAIRLILDNLIDNAIKYTPDGGRLLVAGRASGEEIAIEVADSGIGIPRDDLPRIFERFYRVDKARSRELGGTGLGLAIVKHLVSALGGRIEVSSRVGAGSRFSVLLPRAPVPVPARDGA